MKPLQPYIDEFMPLYRVTWMKGKLLTDDCVAGEEAAIEMRDTLLADGAEHVTIDPLEDEEGNSLE